MAALLIADVPWLLYRSFFGLPKSIVDSEGNPVNALLGTVNALLAAIEPGPYSPRGPRAVIACTGAEQAAYRVELYPPYHANRDPMPPELAAQWQKAPRLLESLGWIVCDGGQLEADDVMFSFAQSEREATGEAHLLTADRDLYGAVSERVSVLEFSKGVVQGLIGPDGVRDRYGVEPEQVPDFIALRGDPSDGLPGAKGIGAKTAAELLRAHGTLEGVLQAATGGLLRERTAASLTQDRDLLLAFKQIATLQLVEVKPPDGERSTDYSTGAQMAAEMGMRRLAERLGKLAKA